MLVATVLTLLYALRVAYANRLMPGVYGDNIYLGGLTKPEAIKLLNDQVDQYGQASVVVNTGSASQTFPAGQLIGRNDSTALVEQLYALGRAGDPFSQLVEQIQLMVAGSDRTASSVVLNQDAAAKSLPLLAEETSKAVQNASFVISGDNLTVNPGQPGQRLNMGLATLQLQTQLGQLKKEVSLSPNQLAPQLDSSQLQRESRLVSPYINTPLVLAGAGQTWKIDANTIINWLKVTSPQKPLASQPLTNYYSQQFGAAGVGFDRNQISAYLGGLAQAVNQDPQDAALTITDGRATVFAQSHDGRALDIAQSTDAVLQALSSGTSEPVNLAIATQKAAVSNETIDSLGIKELVSEGVTYFPNSPPNRLQNVRVGAARFNGVLLKPGQVFSFGEFLGPVGPEQGYTPGLIILGDHEEKAYGGGLCQVSSTAFRAALMAGFPILERLNHAFAISYYTAPYGVPGVDATIFYPQVDMKFRNTTDHYILIQTNMVGTTLKFDFYGTKKTAGVIRGPNFVTGSNDPTKPSQTVFYRDVTDLSGKVIKTDTFNTYYKSSLDFPVTD